MKRSTPASRDAGRLAYVDGLRAVAVLLVVLFHARVHMPGVELGTFFKECSHGVDLFFVLSGFCLALPALERLQSAGRSRFDVAAFAVKRCLRILPPYATALLLFAVAGSIATARGIGLPPGMSPSIAWGDLPAQLLFLDRNVTLVNHSFWTLAVEFRWYLLFPLALALGAARPRALLLVIGLAIVASETTRATSTDMGVLDAFLLGIVAAQLRASGKPFAKPALLLIGAGIALGLVLERSYHFPIQTNSGWHLAAFGLVVYAGESPVLQRLLSNRPLVAIGIASYSVYLVHEPIVSATVIALARLGSPLAAGSAAVALSLLGGFTLWAVIERPITNRLFVARVVRNARSSVVRIFETVHLPAEFELRRPPGAEGGAPMREVGATAAVDALA